MRSISMLCGLVFLCFVPSLWAAITLNDVVTTIIGIHYCVRPDKESNSNLILHHLKTEELCLAHCSGCRWTTRHGYRDVLEFEHTMKRTMATFGAMESHVRITWLVKIKDDIPLSSSHISEWEQTTGIHFGQFLHSEMGDYFIVLATKAQAQVIGDLPEVADLIPYPSYLKVAPHLIENMAGVIAGAAGPLSRPVYLLVSLHRKSPTSTIEDATSVASDIVEMLVSEGVTREKLNVKAEDDTVISVEAPAHQLESIVDALASVEDVSWVDLSLQFKPLNYLAKSLVQSGTVGTTVNTPGATPFHDAGLHGENEVVAVADSGSDYNTCYFFDPNVAMQTTTGQTFTSTTHRKYATYTAYADGNEGENAGHGTHVSSTILGNAVGGAPNQPNGNGHAYNARLSFFDIGQANQQFLTVPNSLTGTMFPVQYNAGARLHSDSWGANSNQYDQRARDIDQYSWTNQDWLVLVAAGNSGANGAGSIGTPATAKNCVTVGASVAPDRGTGCAEGPAPCQENMASFSSLGPMYDNRQAPTIVAPGYFTVSARSTTSLTVGTTPVCTTTQMAGTSMATPTVTGNAALVRQYFREGRYPDGVVKAGRGFNAMGALVKAVLVNSAKNMIGRRGNTAGTLATAPSTVQGFGRVTLNRTLPLPVSQAFNFWALGDNANKPTLVTGQSFVYAFDVQAGYPFRVTLVWSDFPSALQAATALVNDLDLNMTRPAGGSTLFPNGRTSPDTLNVVEQIDEPNPVAGVYTVRVTGRRVVQGPQPFAIVASGKFTATTPGATPPTTPSNPFTPPNPTDPSQGASISAPTSKNMIAAAVMMPLAIIACGVLLFLFGSRLGDRAVAMGSSMGHGALNGVNIFFGFTGLLLILIATGADYWAKQGNFHMGLWKSCPEGMSCTDTLEISDGKNMIYALRFFMMTSIFTAAFTVICAVCALTDKLSDALYGAAFYSALTTSIFTFISMCLFAAYFNDVLSPLSADSVETDYCYYLCIASFFVSLVASLLVYSVWKNHSGGASTSSSSLKQTTARTAPAANKPTSAPPTQTYSSPAPIAVSSRAVPTRAPPPRGPPPAKSSLPAGWIAYTTDEGDPYYYNTNTQETRWEVPTS